MNSVTTNLVEKEDKEMDARAIKKEKNRNDGNKKNRINDIYYLDR